MARKIRLIKIREAAELLGVNPETLRRWDRAGRLKSVIVSTRGDRRYKRENIEKFIAVQSKRQV